MKTNCLGMILTKVLNLGITIIFKAMDLPFMEIKLCNHIFYQVSYKYINCDGMILQERHWRRLKSALKWYMSTHFLLFKNLYYFSFAYMYELSEKLDFHDE